MGAYYRAALRILGNPKAIREELKKLLPMMEQGCLGQLPEIYDGNDPYEGKGCFAQAWSVGEMLRVLEDLQAMEA
jgi:glycogen debranching enzyme